MSIYEIEGIRPTLDDSAYVAPNACVVGRVTLGPQASVWPAAILRGDNERISVGSRSNVQDGAVLHTDVGYPLAIGEDTSIGHGAVLHGCTVGAASLVGVRAVILNGACIGDESIVGAGALVTEGKVFGPRSLIIGAPARAVRALSDEEVACLRKNADDYVLRAEVYRRSLVIDPENAGQGNAEC